MITKDTVERTITFEPENTDNIGNTEIKVERVRSDSSDSIDILIDGMLVLSFEGNELEHNSNMLAKLLVEASDTPCPIELAK